MRMRPGGFPQKHALIKTAGGFPSAVFIFDFAGFGPAAVRYGAALGKLKRKILVFLRLSP
jgi:hypothetical protein